jgi:hypothetical protein
MKKLIQWFRQVNQDAKARAKLILEARETMSNMDAPWRAANTSNDAVALLLMRLGLAHVKAVYFGQLEAQNLIRGRKARLN